MICGAGGAPADALRTLTQLTGCCLGAAEGGPVGCTCWEPVYDLEQQPVDREAEPGTRSAMCADCAYRSTSPEAKGDPSYSPRPEHGDGTFWCHQGMRKPVAWRHPLGITVEATGDFYDPPIHRSLSSGEPVPFRADGTPGERCAGWAAHRRDDNRLLADLAEQAGEAVAPLP